LPDDFDVLEGATVERSYGWVIFPQTKEYIKTQNVSSMAIGCGSTLVERHTGRCINFPKAYPVWTNLRIYRAGYLDHPNYDVIITKVFWLGRAIHLLRGLRITYAVPEVECGITWRIPQDYTREQLREKLSRLPCRFNLGYLYFKWKALEKMRRSWFIKFSLVPNEGHRNDEV